MPALPFQAELARILFWLAAGASAAAGLSATYRFGPAERRSTWNAVMPGATLAEILWLAATGLFSLYLSGSDNLGRVYGSIEAVIFLQFWLLASAMIFLLGARFNYELRGDEAARDRRVYRSVLIDSSQRPAAKVASAAAES